MQAHTGARIGEQKKKKKTFLDEQSVDDAIYSTLLFFTACLLNAATCSGPMCLNGTVTYPYQNTISFYIVISFLFSREYKFRQVAGGPCARMRKKATYNAVRSFVRHFHVFTLFTLAVSTT